MHKDRMDQFEALTLPHLDALFRAALALCHREDQAADLVQTTYLKAMENFDSFRPGTNCKAWLMRILRNGWIDRLRHERTVKFVPLDEEHPPAGRVAPEEPAGEGVDVAAMLEGFSDAQVIRALKQLPPDQRLAVLLVDVEQMDHRQVADILEVAVGTIKSRTSRARMALKGKLLDHAKELGLVKP